MTRRGFLPAWLLSGLHDRGVPMHWLGLQGHIGGTSWAQFDAASFAGFLRDVARLGLRISIPELDVKDTSFPADVALRDAFVAEAYRDYLTVALAEPAVAAVITWGLRDRYTWIGSTAPRSDGLSVRPLPLDRDMQRKPAWDAIAAAFRGWHGASTSAVPSRAAAAFPRGAGPDPAAAPPGCTDVPPAIYRDLCRSHAWVHRS